jgi:hypothetical protein
MSLELDELLTLAGHLDDTPGFDSPRERFRRFLIDRASNLSVLETLIEQAQRSVGQQRHRALQDLITVVGRSLQFEIKFGDYELNVEGARALWRSRGALELVLDVRTDQTADASVDALAKAVSTIETDPPRADSEKRIGLCVTSRHYAARARLEATLGGVQATATVAIVSVQSLLTLAAHVAAGRFTHADVVKLFASGAALDVVIELIGRPAVMQEPRDDAAPRSDEPASAVVDRHEPSFWVATITGDRAASAEQLLEYVIVGRRVLGTCYMGPRPADAASGDWVCFFIRDKGIVGHAQLASVVEDGASVVRDGGTCSGVFQLNYLAVYAQPVAQALRAGRPFTVPSIDAPLSAPCLTPIARSDYVALTKYEPAVPTVLRAV